MQSVHPLKNKALFKSYTQIMRNSITGKLLYLEKGKKKDQLIHFFRWVGDDFMSHVKAIAIPP